MLEQLNSQVEVLQQSEDFARFQVEPLERGFGLTLGNALRRVLLSSLPGAAVTSVRIQNVYHEFAAMPGVKEDTTELLLNLKQLRLKSHTDQPVTLRLEAQGPGVVTAADLIYPSEIEIANPELHIATLDSADARLDMELTVERGVGYRPSDGREAVALGEVPVDAVFTPIRRVNYSVESARVGARTDLDRLVIELQTDGTIAPMAALVTASNLLIDQFALFQELQQEKRRADKQGLSTGPGPVAHLRHADRTARALAAHLQLPQALADHQGRPDPADERERAALAAQLRPEVAGRAAREAARARRPAGVGHGRRDLARQRDRRVPTSRRPAADPEA